MVVIKHAAEDLNGDGKVEYIYTLYGHLQDNSIPSSLQVGQEIGAKEQIGAIGDTGITTGPTLHFDRLCEKHIN